MKFEYHYNFNVWSENALELAIYIAFITAGTKIILRILDKLYDYLKSQSQQRHDKEIREMKNKFEKLKRPSLYKEDESEHVVSPKSWVS